MMQHIKNLAIAFVVFAACFTVISASPASAKLMITPYHIVIEGRDRFAEVNLINAGDETLTYEMGWRFLRQNEDRTGYHSVDQSITDFDLTEHIAFSPRRVTLAPRERQKVRMALRLPEGPPAPGDYRAHMSFRQLLDSPEEQNAMEGRASVAVRVAVGFSIPVIYRVGESNATAQIGEINLTTDEDGKPLARVPVTRGEGPYGITGYLRLYHQPASGGEEELVGELANAFLFPELISRTYNVPLKVENLRGGTLRVVYEDRVKDERNIIAERSFPIGR